MPEPSTAPAPAGVVSVPLDDLVLDPTLQCRTEVVADVVEQYAEALSAGATFPPIRVLRVDGRLLVVDGWHRVHAHRRAGVGTIEAHVVDGNRREALLAAVAANADHGLQRTQADKRRAVIVLLQDAEWCRLSSRELAGIGRVSHTFVDNVRKHYGAPRGTVLTGARIAEVDGEPPPAWRAVLAAAPLYGRADVDQIRLAPGPLELADVWLRKGSSYGGWQKEAYALRAAELAVDPWPWLDVETPAARLAILRGADTVEDLVAVARTAEAAASGDLDQVYGALRAAIVLRQGKSGRWALEAGGQIAQCVAGRPLLEAQRREQLEAIREKEANRRPEPWELARRVHVASDAQAQEALLGALPVGVVRQLVEPSRLFPSVRDGVYREVVCPEDLGTCSAPGCGGWLRPPALTGGAGVCAHCGRHPDRVAQQLAGVARVASEIARAPGWGLEIDLGDGTEIVDGPTLRLLRILRAEGHQLAGEGPAATALRDWLDGDRPSHVAAPPPEEPEADVDEDLSDAEGVDPDDEDLDEEFGDVECPDCGRTGGSHAIDCEQYEHGDDAVVEVA